MFQPLIPEESIVLALRERRSKQVYHFPHVTIFMPFETKLQDKRIIEQSLFNAVDMVSSKLGKRFPGDLGELVEQKLENIIRNLNYNTLRKSIAIFVSPVFENVLYLNFEVEERVVVGGRFQIRDIVQSRRLPRQFHVLVLDENEGRIFLDDATSSIHLYADDSYRHKKPDKYEEEELSVGKNSEDKNNYVNSFLHRINQSLNDILLTRRLPVFVMGNKSLLHQFRAIAHPNGAIAGWVEGKFRGLSLQQLKQRLQPLLLNWQFLRQQHLSHLLENAVINNSLVTGFSQVQKNIMKHHGKILLIGKRYLYTGKWQEPDDRMSGQKKLSRYSYLKDSIDEMVEKLLEDGGDVELVDDVVLEEYKQIALITY